jgi:hypothetical protein
VPELVGDPQYDAGRRTCVVQVRLEPGRSYACWLNHEQLKNFKDAQGRPAVPYLLAFRTDARPAASPFVALNDNQRRVLEWTDRQFRNFFDTRTFEGWTVEERVGLEFKLLDALNGPVTREFYQAINSLAALRSTKALPKLRELAFDRRDKDNRDRWMALRALGLLGDKPSIPSMIHLLYHGNVNTRWWAQISLVRLTGQNFGGNWPAWGRWWNDSGGQPPWNPEIIRWWDGQPEADQLASTLAERDVKFLAELPPLP